MTGSAAIAYASPAEESWQQSAFEYLVHFITHEMPRLQLEVFMAEDLRAWAHEEGLERPKHTRSWGAVMQRGAREGLIRKVGTGPRRIDSANSSAASRWERLNLHED